MKRTLQTTIGAILTTSAIAFFNPSNYISESFAIGIAKTNALRETQGMQYHTEFRDTKPDGFVTRDIDFSTLSDYYEQCDPERHAMLMNACNRFVTPEIYEKNRNAKYSASVPYKQTFLGKVTFPELFKVHKYKLQKDTNTDGVLSWKEVF